MTARLAGEWTDGSACSYPAFALQATLNRAQIIAKDPSIQALPLTTCHNRQHALL
jgi:hypothetical protein